MAISIDISRGVDVFCGSKLIAHFEGAHALEIAKAYAAQGRGRYVRYWGLKPSEGK